jgi:hypothetical protein
VCCCLCAASLQSCLSAAKSSEDALRRELSDERAVSGDMELELQIVMSQLADRVAEAERHASEKHTEVPKEDVGFDAWRLICVLSRRCRLCIGRWMN